MNKIKKGDTVIVIAGKDKGKSGNVKKMLPRKNRVIVEQVNIIKKHAKPTQANPTGGITETEASLHISNVMLLDSKTGTGTRVGFTTSKDGSKVRKTSKSKSIID